jgi:hypothetical protein
MWMDSDKRNIKIDETQNFVFWESILCLQHQCNFSSEKAAHAVAEKNDV